MKLKSNMFFKRLANKFRSINSSIGCGKSCRAKINYISDNGLEFYLDTYIVIPSVFFIDNNKRVTIDRITKWRLARVIEDNVSILSCIGLSNGLDQTILKFISVCLTDFKNDLMFDVNDFRVKTKQMKRDDKIDNLLN